MFTVKNLYRRRIVHERIRRARRIIDFSFEMGASLRSRLTLRSKPNLRLVHAFGIFNSFTTTDPVTHKAFVTKATKLLNRITTPEQWQPLHRNAEALLQRHIRDSSVGWNYLGPCVRSLCLRLVMAILFEVNPLDISDDDVTTVCTQINLQWIQSKHNDAIEQSPFLNAILGKLLEHGMWPDLKPQEALELILPAYETLWRVVLLTFVTACHRNAEPHPLLQADVYSCLGTKSDVERNVLKIAKEGLRLYPSSKRIYRSKSLTSDATISADVQALHRDSDVWGRDAHVFRPERFDDWKLTSLQKEAFVPFGLRPHLCPAFSGFGERLVTLLVVVLGVHFGPEKATVRFHDADLDSSLEASLPTGRDDMENWVIEMRR